MANVLIASLGDSPVVVSAMYHLLKEREGLEIAEVHVLVPEDKLVRLSYDLVEEALQDECKVKPIELNFDDANSVATCLQFLQVLVEELRQQKRQQNTVYLSLAGGRKSMAALIAWVAPFFSCIKDLYHVLDPNEKQFPSLERMYNHYSDAGRKRLMCPAGEELEKLKLVKIPFAQELRVSSSFFSFLEKLDEEGLKKIQQGQNEEDPENLQNETLEAAVTLFQQVNSSDKILDVYVTKLAAEQYKELYKKDTNRARSVRVQYLNKMRTAEGVRALLRIRTDDVYDKSGPGIPHYFKSMRTMVRPLIYTVPNTHSEGHEELKKVVVCALEVKKNNGYYPPLQEITSGPKFSWEPFCSIDKLPQMSEDREKEHILLVPLGTRPMIVTQLYTLLTEEEGIPIQEIILFYPDNREIGYGVKLLERVLRNEKRKTGKNIKLSSVKISGSDIDSEEKCAEFQQKLENKIKDIQKTSSGVLLSLSGGRKGMAAMSMFVAQKMNLPHVYHTLISDEKLDKKIEEETSIEVLLAISSAEELNDRLFLRSYDRSKFALFPVPVLQKQWAIVSDK